uniref:Uncharacterized protein n=1 Tax=Eptatretus burgeri TaxID=7764 RepID=A0A8C4Q3M2_EPTBU
MLKAAHGPEAPNTNLSRGIVVGAPKGQSGQANVTEGGAVFLCPWPQSSSHCTKIDFNRDGDRYQLLRKDAPQEQMEFQSHQWFGASVRSQDSTVLACAPLYSWRTYKLGEAEREPVGTCYLVVGNFSHYAEYAPCRTSRGGSGGQGSCQAGFSSEITKDGRVVLGGPGSFFWQGQVISAPQRAVLQPKASRYLLRTLRGQVESREGNATADDGYMGYSITMGEFTGDSVQEYVTGVPKGSSMIGHVSIFIFTIRIMQLIHSRFNAPAEMFSQFSSTSKENACLH